MDESQRAPELTTTGERGNSPVDLGTHRGEYGIDAPYVPVMLGSGGIVLIAFAVASMGSGAWTIAPLLGGLSLLLSTASYLYATRTGRFAVWAITPR